MTVPIGTIVVRSLTREQAIQIARDYGLVALLSFMQFFNQVREGRAHRQQQQTYQAMQDAIPKLLNLVESKEIRVVAGAFNTSATFISTFQAAAIVAIPLVLLHGASAIKRVGSSLEGIRSELAITNVAKIQGWEKDGFGAHVHRFVRNEMAAVTREEQQDEDRQRHFFYVWNPDTDWYPVFEERQAESPLGPEFGGYHSDLATICLRMRSDRETLTQTTSYGRTAVFHLLIPAYGPIVIDYPITFHEGLLPLVITGQRHRDVDFVWLNLRRRSRELSLNYVGILESKVNPAVKSGATGFIVCWLGCAACGVASIAFPPCAPAATNVAVSFWSGAFASWTVAAGGGIYGAATERRTEVLGDPIFLTPR